MKNSEFSEYYKEIRDRDNKILDETPLPTSKSKHNVWTVLGLSLGIASIVFIFFIKYDIILGVVAMVLSTIGCIKKKTIAGIMGVLCSLIGISLAIALMMFQSYVMQIIHMYLQ